MNLLKSKLRRTTAVLAGAFIGLAGAVAIAAPASAHAPTVDGAPSCLKDGSWTIDWSIGNDYETPATVKKITVKAENPDGNGAQDAELTGDIITPGKEIPANSDKNPALQIHGSTHVTDAKIEWVNIRVRLQWPDGHVTKPEDAATKRVKRPADCKPTDEPTPPTDEPTPPTDEPTPPTAPGAPTPIEESDCTTITLGLDNPEDGEDITLTFKTSKGESRELEIKAGEKKTTKFSASEGFTVEIGAKGLEGSTTVEYQQPEGCASGGGAGDGDLPLTGAAAGSIAGGAAILLVGGAVLFMVARRRRVKFTA